MTEEQEELIINGSYIKLITTLNSINGDGDEIIEPYKLISKSPTDHFMLKYFTNTSNIIFPENCRYFKDTGTRFHILIEHEPRIRTITVNSDLYSLLERHKINGKFDEYGLKNFDINKTPYRFTLSFPYILYFISLSKSLDSFLMHCYFRLHPFSSMEDYLIRPSVPNISKDGSVCLGETKTKRFEDPNSAVEEIIKSFWVNKFNNDLFPVEYEDNPYLTDYFSWQYHTKKDPLFIFSDACNWKILNFTFQEFLDRITECPDVFNLVNNFKNYVKNERSIKNEKPIEKFKLLTKSININGTFYSIGDEILKDEKRYYIHSINRSCKTGYNISIDLEDENGNITTIDLTNTEYFQNLRKNEIESYEVDGVEYKKGDFIFRKQNNDIKSIRKIIKLRDQSIYFHIGKDFYFGNSLKRHFEKINKLEIKIKDVILEDGEKYVIIQEDLSNGFLLNYSNLTYRGIETSGDYFQILFYDTSGNPISFDYSYKDDLRLIDKKLVISNPPFYRVNERLYTEGDGSKAKISLLKNNGLGVVTSKPGRQLSSYDYTTYLNYDKIKLDEYLSTVKDEFFIPGFDFDLNYKIGDEVIHIDWKNANEMLKIKTIQSFSLKITDNESNFSINLIDESGNTSEVSIIRLLKKSGSVFSGIIRKVCRKLNDIEIGTKVIAKMTGITDFPKKDCNEIKAFVIDCEIPLVLFSNFRTIHFTKLEENFNLIDKENLKYNKLKTSEPSLKIKMQSRDLFLLKQVYISSGTGSSEYLHSIDPERSFAAQYIYETLDQFKDRYGLLLPRISENLLRLTHSSYIFPGSRSNATKLINHRGSFLSLKDF